MQPDESVFSQFLRLAFLRSPNYAAGVSGWTINQDGSAEFNNLTIRGTFNGTNFVINSSGAFFYNGTPAAGNLIASIASASGTDSHGNTYLAGITSYDTSFGGVTEIDGANVELFSGLNLLQILNPNGHFIYTPNAAAGNLIASVAPAGGTDGFGNAYQRGVTSYGANPGIFTEINSGQVAQSSNAAGTQITHAGSMSLVDALLVSQAPAIVLSSPNTGAAGIGVSRLGVVGSSFDASISDAVVVFPVILATLPGGTPGQTPETWHTATNQNGFSSSLNYRLAPDGMLQVQGVQTAGATFANGTVCSATSGSAYAPAGSRDAVDQQGSGRFLRFVGGSNNVQCFGFTAAGQAAEVNAVLRIA